MKSEPETEEKKDLLDTYRTAIKDIRYIMRQYKNYTVEAWETIRKLVEDKKLR